MDNYTNSIMLDLQKSKMFNNFYKKYMLEKTILDYVNFYVERKEKSFALMSSLMTPDEFCLTYDFKKKWYPTYFSSSIPQQEIDDYFSDKKYACGLQLIHIDTLKDVLNKMNMTYKIKKDRNFLNCCSNPSRTYVIINV
ncbi:hypothetical protein EBU95_17995 [bacterium]|uniref:Uncharacterized protein n=1 Tax=viral metagenome TaxID=1070528 RepID=A0A6C0EC54_9ZZZZ|nr:hypothetical protein [bacterium]